MNPNVQKRIPGNVTADMESTQNRQSAVFGEKRPLNGEKIKFCYETIHADTDSRISAKLCGNP